MINKLQVIKGLAVITCACAASIGAAFALSACSPKDGDKPVAHVHTYGEWTTVKPAKCEEDGEEQRVCTGCEEGAEGHTETRVITKLGHNYQEEITNQATCYSTGTKLFTCQNDSNHQYIESIPKLPHEYGEWDITEPTEKVVGKAVKTCINCTEEANGHVYEVELPILGDERYVLTGNTETCGLPGTATYSIDLENEKSENETFSFLAATKPTGNHPHGAWPESISDVDKQRLMASAIQIHKTCDVCNQSMDDLSLDTLKQENVKTGVYTYLEEEHASCTANGKGKYTTDYEKLKAENVSYEFEVEIPQLPHEYEIVSGIPESGTENTSGAVKERCKHCQDEINLDYDGVLTAGGNAQNAAIEVKAKKYFVKFTNENSNYFYIPVNQTGNYSIKLTEISNATIQSDENWAAIIGGSTWPLGKITPQGNIEKLGGRDGCNFTYNTTSTTLNYSIKNFGISVTNSTWCDKNFIFNLIGKGAEESNPANFIMEVEIDVPPINIGSETSIFVPETKTSTYLFARKESDPTKLQINVDDVLQSLETLKVVLDKKDGQAENVIYDSSDESKNGVFEITDTQTHTLTFTVGKVPADNSFAVKITQDYGGVKPDNNLRPDNKIEIQLDANSGTCVAEISNVAKEGWYKVYPTWNSSLGQANLNVKVNDGNPKNLQVGSRAPSSKNDYDQFAILAYLKPGDKLTYTNKGMLAVTLELNMVAHTHDSAKEFKIDKYPTADQPGKAKRDCDGVWEEFTLPVLGSELYTKDNNDYTITIDGVTIKFTVTA